MMVLNSYILSEMTEVDKRQLHTMLGYYLSQTDYVRPAILDRGNVHISKPSPVIITVYGYIHGTEAFCDHGLGLLDNCIVCEGLDQCRRA